MGTRTVNLVGVVLLTAMTVAGVWLAAAMQPPVRVRVVELTTNSHGLWTVLAPPIGSQAAYALIEVTNAGARSIKYRCLFGSKPGRPQFAYSSVSYQYASGWGMHPLPRRG